MGHVMQSNLCSLKLALITCLLAPALTACAERQAIHVSPQMTPLPKAGVPQLHEQVKEAVDSSDGLILRSTTANEWSAVAGSSQTPSFTAQVDREKFDHAILTIWNWHNRAIAQKKIDSSDAVPFELKIEGLGIYLITLDGYRGDKCVGRGIRSIGVTRDLSDARKTWKTDEFFLGVCAFPGRYHWKSNGKATIPQGVSEDTARELEASLMARLGFQVIRADVSMEMGQRIDAGKRRYSHDFRRMDSAIKAYTSRGFRLAFQLMNAPDWAIEEEYANVKSNRWRYPRQRDPQQHYIASLLDRYGKHARFIQVFNEPDQIEFWAGTKEEFVTQYQFSREQIRRSLQTIPIANGGYAFIDQDKTKFFVEQIKGAVDLPAYHSHGNLRELKKDFALMEKLHDAAGYTKPTFLNTETGYAAWRLDQERRQAQAVAQKALYCWANGHKGVLLFCSRMTRSPGRTGRDFGFLDFNFCPRFAYGSIAAMTSSLAGASYHSTAIESDSTHVYRFQRGKDTVLATFTIGLPTTINVKSNAKRITIVDGMGNEQERVRDNQDELTVSLDGYPRYVILKDTIPSSVEVDVDKK